MWYAYREHIIILFLCLPRRERYTRSKTKSIEILGVYRSNLVELCVEQDKLLSCACLSTKNIISFLSLYLCDNAMSYFVIKNILIVPECVPFDMFLVFVKFCDWLRGISEYTISLECSRYAIEIQSNGKIPDNNYDCSKNNKTCESDNRMKYMTQ